VLTYSPNMRIGEKIAAARKALPMSQMRLAELVGVAQTTISKWERGASEPSRTEARAVERALHLPVFALDMGDATAEPRRIPVWGDILAGSSVQRLSNDFPLEYIDAPPGAPDEAVCAIVCGASMMPYLRPGNVLVWWRWYDDPRHLVGEPCVVRLMDDGMVVKQLEVGSRFGFWNLVSLNATEPTIRDVRIRGAAPIEIVLRRKDWRG
jgi:transcriptional regulator with XRE-family HTH domain